MLYSDIATEKTEFYRHGKKKDVEKTNNIIKFVLPKSKVNYLFKYLPHLIAVWCINNTNEKTKQLLNVHVVLL